MQLAVVVTVSLAIDELEPAIVRELSARLELERLQAMQETFTKLQRSLVFYATHAISPLARDTTARAFATTHAFVAFSSITQLPRLVKCPTFEESGLEQGLWTAQAKMECLKSKFEEITLSVRISSATECHVQPLFTLQFAWPDICEDVSCARHHPQ